MAAVIRALVILASWGVLVAGCRTSHEDRARRTTGNTPLSAPSWDEVQLGRPDDGGPVIGAQLPDDFPKEIPLYPGGRLVAAAKSTGPQGRPAWSVTLETGDTKDRVVDFYKNGMPAFRLATSMDMGDTGMCVWQGSQYDATLMATVGADHKTTATLTAAGK